MWAGVVRKQILKIDVVLVTLSAWRGAGRRGGAQCRAPPGRGALVGQPGEEETTMDPDP